ncbi:MAG: phosphoribosylformylglycinamidine cyclo-ligase [Pseudomonadota bacterium]
MLTYKDSGVDIDAGNRLVKRIADRCAATHRPEVLTGLGGFGGLFQLDLSRFNNPVLVSGTDGVGTKLLLARALQQHASIGIDLVAMCVNDIVVSGAEPLFFLDYFATGVLDEAQAASVIEGIATGCEQAGCALIGGETAEMPGVYAAGDYDLAGFSVGCVDRDKLVDGSRVRVGDTLVGIRSSGPHSNGYSLIRAVVEQSGQALDTLIDGHSLADALMAPTRIYVKPLLALCAALDVHAIAHITGGGLTENIPRVLPAGTAVDIDYASWSRPAIFDWLAQHGDIAEAEMRRTFNCGIGMVIAMPPQQVDDALALLHEHGEQAVPIGTIVADGSA